MYRRPHTLNLISLGAHSVSGLTRCLFLRVKGKNFNIPNLLNLEASDLQLLPFQDGSIAIFRLAPADYHRFHSPIDGEVGKIIHVPGKYYTGEWFYLRSIPNDLLHTHFFSCSQPTSGQPTGI